MNNIFKKIITFMAKNKVIVTVIKSERLQPNISRFFLVEWTSKSYVRTLQTNFLLLDAIGEIVSAMNSDYIPGGKK